MSMRNSASCLTFHTLSHLRLATRRSEQYGPRHIMSGFHADAFFYAVYRALVIERVEGVTPSLPLSLTSDRYSVFHFRFVI